MAIALKCPCGHRLQVPDDQAGETVRCPACDQERIVPIQMDVSDNRTLGTGEDRPWRAWASAEPGCAFARRRDEDDDERPRRRRRSEDEDDSHERKRRPPAVTSGKATASLILGLLGLLCFGFLTGLPGLIVGGLSLRDISQSRGRVGGKGLAIAGLILSTLSTLISLVVYPYMYRSVRYSLAFTDSSTNLRQIGQAMHRSIDANGRRLPPHGAVTSRDGRPLLSWRVALLPYLGQQGLYQQFHLEEPWDSPHNRTLIPLMPKVFVHPLADSSVTAQGMTHYRAVTGPLSAFAPPAGPQLPFPASVTDGTVNTILAAEAAEPVVWTRPDDLDLRPGDPLPRLGLTPGRPFLVVLWDGTVRPISPRMSPATLQAALTANGGEILGPDW